MADVRHACFVLDCLILDAMIRKFLIVCFTSLVVSIAACKEPQVDAPMLPPTAYIPDPFSVPFDITPLASSDGAKRWMGRYTSHGKTAKFEIEFGPATVLGSGAAEPVVVTSGSGKFVAVDGSDAGGLLIDLKQALEAKHIPKKNQRVPVLLFAFVNLGNNQSQASGGGFAFNPPGNWSCIKIFVGERKQEGQVFVNLNPKLGKGQFSIKDTEYGDLVLKQLAKVL